MPRQRELFTDPHIEWRLGRRSVHIVSHPSKTCVRLRIRWSNKLGLELQHDIYSRAHAEATVRRIIARGAIQRDRWRAYYNPQWTPSCETIRRPAHG